MVTMGRPLWKSLPFSRCASRSNGSKESWRNCAGHCAAPKGWSAGCWLRHAGQKFLPTRISSRISWIDERACYHTCHPLVQAAFVPGVSHGALAQTQLTIPVFCNSRSEILSWELRVAVFSLCWETRALRYLSWHKTTASIGVIPYIVGPPS